MPAPIVALRNVHRVYKQASLEVRALDGLSLEIAGGDINEGDALYFKLQFPDPDCVSKRG